MIEEYLSEKQKKRKKRRSYVTLVAAFIAAYFFLFGAGWFVLRSPFFRVNQVIINGTKNVSEGDVLSLLESSALRGHNSWKAFLGFRNILMWPNALTADDLAFNPRLASVTISKEYFSHTITATVVERTPVAIWCLMPKIDERGNPAGDERCYWFDDTGIVFERAFDTQGSLMFAIHDYSQSSLALNSKILPDSFVKNLLSIINVIKGSGIDINEIALNDIGLQEIDVTTYDGPALYFSLRFSADTDLPVLQNLIAKPGFNKLQYIDFRVENRAYYK